MKIRFTQDYHDGERLFKNGWVIEVGPSDGNRLIQQGFAKEESNMVYSRKYNPTATPTMECIVPAAPEPEGLKNINEGLRNSTKKIESDKLSNT